MLRRIEVNSANRSLPGRYKLLLAAILLSVLVFAAWQPVKDKLSTDPTESTKTETNTELSVDKTTTDPDTANTADTDNVEANTLSTDSSDTSSDLLTNTPTDELANDLVNEYIISSDDTLAKVLESHDIGFKEVFVLTKKFPTLEKDLRPGQLISWTTNEDGHLQNLTWTLNRKETRLYDLTEEDGFVETVELTKGEWKEFVISGSIDPGSTLCSAAITVGLSNNECLNAERYLKYQANLNALRPGDHFTFFIEREFVSGQYSGTRLLAAKINTRKRDRYIIYFDKYRAYYDEEGKPLTDGFLRIPTLNDNKKYRISSHFNPRRLHPVTKRIAPHNGVDFAMPIGTPLVAAGDGEVVIARFSATAGNYVAIRHGKQYSTRYLHMNKITVRPGQIVKRGDLIGYSGNTGRSTGPHLHYEFLVDNKHVDPMKMTLPRPEGLKNSDLKEFVTYADTVKTKFTESFELYKQEQAKLAEEKKIAEEKLKLEQAAEATANAAQEGDNAETSEVKPESDAKPADDTKPEPADESESKKDNEQLSEAPQESEPVKAVTENSAS